jgi:hypothetical protein
LSDASAAARTYMALTPAQLNQSGLIRRLAQMALIDSDKQPEPAELRLGKLLDLSKSIRIAAAQLPCTDADTDSDAAASQATTIRADYLQVRAALIKGIELSFNPGQLYTRIKLPTPQAATLTDDQVVLGQYQRFYASHQRDIIFRIQGLRERVSNGVGGISQELRQLVSLDATIADSISQHSNACFGSIPSLLSKRFDQLNQPQITISGAATHQQFSSELKNLLLAEIDARLLPILGLVEAMEDHLMSHTL